MDYEKKYKETLEKAKVFLKRWECVEEANSFLVLEEVKGLFPELAEREDERIRNAIIRHIKDLRFYDIYYDVTPDEMIAWLEKQGNTNETINMDKFAQSVLRGAAITLITWIDYNAAEGNMCLSNMECKDIEDSLVSGDWNKIYAYIKKKLEKQGGKPKGKSALDAAKEEKVNNQNCVKSTDNVEPKFKVGDWIVCNVTDSVHQIKDSIENLSNHKYGYDLTKGGYIGSDEVNNYHLWTIKDAKPGDVLVCKGNIKGSNGITYERICLFNNLNSAFFTLTKTSNCVEEYAIDVNIDYPDNTVPATKEQKEILFMAMKEAGYEWDSKNKELKKTEKKGGEE